jgi:hypothetical protein
MSSPLHPAPPADRSVKIPHLVLGLLFLGLAGIWALGVSGVLRGEELTILAPGVLVAAGVIGLVASLAGARNRSRRRAGSVPATESFLDDPDATDHHTGYPAHHPDDTQEIR